MSQSVPTRTPRNSPGERTDSRERRSKKKPLTIKSLLIITTVFASTAASAAHLYRAANGSSEEIGQFVVVTAMSPLLLMVGVYWTLRIARHLK